MEQQPPAVTDHSSTSDEQQQPELIHVPQSNIPPPQTTSPTSDGGSIHESTTLTFPTLSPDGSIDDLSSVPCPPPETPPAALSELGRKVKMPRTSMSDSSSSLDDVQYDMIDDVSDFSNDDRETASLASTERGEDAMTPEGSIVDVQEERDELTSTTLRGSFETLPGPRVTRSDSLTRAENALLDSYMTDDLETPRQSLLRGTGFEPPSSSSGTDPSVTSLQQSRNNEQKPIRILFVSERGVSDEEITRLCKHLATCLRAKSDATSKQSAVRLPPPPSGTKELSPIFIIAGDVELVVEHCVHAIDSPTRFCIRSGNEECMVDFKDMDVPDLVIYYISPDHGYPTWFITIKDAMCTTDPATMTLCAPAFDFEDLSGVKENLARDSDLVLSSELFSEDCKDYLRANLEILLQRKPKTTGQVNSREHPDRIEKLAKRGHMIDYIAMGLIIVLITLLPLIFGIGYVSTVSDPARTLAVRRTALSNALVEATNCSQPSETFNIEHLVPQEQLSKVGIRCQGVAPNHVVVSLPQKTRGSGFASPTAWRVYRKGGQTVTNNVTELISGVHYVSIAPYDAYGVIHANFALNNPHLNGTCSINFGNRMLQRRIYEKVSTEISRVVNKDVALASQTFKSVTEKLGVELTAGAAATKNVTTQLAVYVARDLQVFAHTAVSVFGKISEEGQGAMEGLNNRIRRDAHKGLIRAEQGLQTLQQAAQKSLQVTSQFTKDLIPTRKTVGTSLSGARDRALSFKNRLAGLKSDTNSTSATKELTLRLQNMFKPSLKGKKAGSWRDIATCARAEDYRTCRREQRKKAKALSAYKPPGALAKMPDADVLKKAAKEHRMAKKTKVKDNEASKNNEGWDRLRKSRDPLYEGKVKKGLKNARKAAR